MKLVAFAGSVRKGSLNQRFVEAAAAVARSKGVEVEVISLADHPLPIFDEDLEAAGFPAEATALKDTLESAAGFLIASPEYNASMPPLLKNAIDWVSRKGGDDKPLRALAGKACGLLAASPGKLGGVRMLPHLRNLLMNLDVHVVPAMFGLGSAHEAFGDDGALKDAGARKFLEKVVDQTIERARALSS